MRPIRLKLISLLSVVFLSPSGYVFSGHEELHRTMVLVTGVYSDIAPLNQAELKKLFLGKLIRQDSRQLLALRNTSDRMLYEVFLQHVVHMSSDIYEKKMAGKAKYPPPDYDDFDLLVQHLIQNKNTVSYMWRENAQTEPRLKIVQVIWTGHISKN